MLPVMNENQSGSQMSKLKGESWEMICYGTALNDGSGTGPKPGQIVYDITIVPSDSEGEVAGKMLILLTWVLPY
jgi:hypothetical protein